MNTKGTDGMQPEIDRLEIRCPQCGSEKYLIGQLGFAGLLGSKKVVVTCLKCGNRWKTKKKD